jgi:hypothetical protein
LIDTAEPRLRRIVRRVAVPVMLAVVTFGTAATGSKGAEAPASPPCAGRAPQPPYPTLGAAPNVRIWKNQTLLQSRSRTECYGWATTTFRTLLAVAGTLQSTDGPDAVLSRFGRISGLLLVRYWSTTDQAWRPLVVTATALTQEVAGRARGDFTVAELKSGQDFYLSQRDSRGANEVIYRMRVRERTLTRFVIETQNVTPVRLWALTVFKPGNLRSLYFIEQYDPGIWRYYALTGVTDGSWLVAGHEKSYVNRAVALYRHFAGIPSDLEPPAAR